ncbi:hypothetical protein [Brevundimonas pondensis]|uniref:Uncharacterized protein n=1 Tax=Brevundimonas pondensis TaxID=2774189 RepID=A0ABX7SNV5_9CAUL|nr:hypothetical protein [Brevundimonas pondensis]QTC88066.1 hypothetical protein IFE19_01270 [Brevundimonas pondensis]
MTTPTEVLEAGADWRPDGKQVMAAARELTKAERRHVIAGYIGGCSAPVLRSLRNKAMFYLKITSPNGRCGHMVLTPLGVNVQALLKSRQASRRGGEA